MNCSWSRLQAQANPSKKIVLLLKKSSSLLQLLMYRILISRQCHWHAMRRGITVPVAYVQNPWLNHIQFSLAPNWKSSHLATAGPIKASFPMPDCFIVPPDSKGRMLGICWMDAELGVGKVCYKSRKAGILSLGVQGGEEDNDRPAVLLLIPFVF